MLQVSPRTVRRRIIQYGLQVEASFTVLSDNELDTITRQFVDTHPNSGESTLAGYLRGKDLRSGVLLPGKAFQDLTCEECRQDKGMLYIKGATMSACPTVCGILMGIIS